MGLGGGEGTLEGVFGWGEGEMGGEDAAVVGGGPSLAIGLTDAGNTAVIDLQKQTHNEVKW